jgi:arylformamidase
MEILDVSVPVRDGMVVYEGDPEVRLERVSSLADGAIANISRLELGVHTGTHVDAPLHFVDGAPGTEALPLDVLVGLAHVVDATSVESALDADALATLDLPGGAERLIFKTRNSQLWELDHFTYDYVSLREDAAHELVERGVRLVGIDYLSIGDEGAHVALLGARVIALEGLDLRAVEAGAYTLFCLPMRLVGSDGAPARAVLLRE